MLFNIFFTIIVTFSVFTTCFFFLVLYGHRHKVHQDGESEDKDYAVIIPAFNEEENIKECIESVKKQEYPKDQVQIKVIDDGSTDNTVEICKEFERRGEIELITKEHEGKVPSVNQALEGVNSDLFCILDADTYFEDKNIFKVISSYFDDENVGACLTTIQIPEPTKWIEKVQLIEYYLSAFMRKILSFFNGLYTTHGASFYRTSAVKKVGLFDETNLVEDMEMTLRLIDNGYEIESDLSTLSHTIPPNNFMDLLKQRLRWYTGFLENMKMYKHMLFNKKYAGIGYVSFPLSLIWTIILMFNMIYMSFNFGSGNFQLFKTLSATNWDILFYIESLIGPLMIGMMDLIIIITTITMILTAYLAFRLVKGTEKSGFSISYIYYFLLFSLIQGIFWFASLVNFLIPREKKPWTGKT